MQTINNNYIWYNESIFINLLCKLLRNFYIEQESILINFEKIQYNIAKIPKYSVPKLYPYDN